LLHRAVAPSANADVSYYTIVLIEGQTLKDSTIAKVRAAFEADGIEFANGGTPGVRIHLTRLNAA
jgi:hypothetical protein